jgi:O-antigen/teichoic acid export membrane protein
MSTVHELVGRIGRHSFVYGVGVGLLMLVSLVNLAVFTRLMPPSAFGNLALLLVLSGALSVIYNLATLQGTLGLVFGKGSEDGVEDDELEPEPREQPAASGKREALGTGLLLTLLISGAGTLIVWALAGDIAQALLDSDAETTGVRLAALAGAGGAIFRILVAIPRLERRPRVYVTLNVVRPALAIAIAVPLVARGDDENGVLGGLVAATAAVVAVSLALNHKAYRIRFLPRLVPGILELGLVFVPVALSIYVINNTGVLLLSGTVSSHEIGLFVVAATIATLILAFATVFFMAWLPMKRTSLFVAVHQERGHGWLYSTLTTYFVLAVCSLFVVVTAAAGALVHLAGSDYADAEKFIPVLGVAAVAHSLFLLAYRISAFNRKRLALGSVTATAAIIFVGGAALLVRPLGAYGVPVAATAAFGAAALTMLVLNQRGSRPIPFDYRRLAVIAGAAAVCVGAHSALTEPSGSLRPLIDVGTVLVYVGILLAANAVSRGEIASLIRIARETVASPRRRRAELSAALRALPPSECRILRQAVGMERKTTADDVVPGALVASLRTLVLAGDPGEHDDEIERYLTSTRSRAERDAIARNLWQAGVPPADLERLETALDELRRLPASAWPAAERSQTLA